MNWRGLFYFSQLSHISRLQRYLCQRCLPSKQPDWACRALLLMCMALSNSCCHQFLGHLFPNSLSTLPFPFFIISPVAIQGAQQIAGEGSPSLMAFSATASISWFLSTQESSPVIISTLKEGITFCRLLAKLSLTVHPTCPAIPIG